MGAAAAEAAPVEKSRLQASMITFDTGALIAIERRRDRMLRVVCAAKETATPIIIPSVALAEWWRGRPPRHMQLLLAGTVIEAVGESLARSAGQAMAAVPAATTVDALVMASAARRGGVVYTSDVDDLVRLQAYFPVVRVLAV
jgi:predicted nucleic acid-binding protein